MYLDKLAIVGGGTSGLVTALILKKSHPAIEIDLIESDKIGIVGVGEGSTEHWQDFMVHCEINTTELIKETDCTFKYGINFVNWNGDQQNYIQTVSSSFNVESKSGSKFIYSYLIANGGTPKNLVHDYVEKSLHRQPYWGINQFHFNTFKLNDFLHRLCEKAGVNILKAEIENITVNEKGEIDELFTAAGEKLKYDFYVDCTGFHRLILKKTLGVAWRSYRKYLPMNSAIAFPTERKEDIESWTLARAMDSGWLWRIPTQNRYGNGYVFNDDFCDFEKAKLEAEKLYNHPIEVAKEIKFDAGCLEKSWVKNCAAIGLSSSFIEPLEASSIGTGIQQAFLFSRLIESYVPGNSYSEKVFNSESDEILENILEFVSLHYLVKRNDTEFWKSVHDLPRPPGLEEKLEIFKNKFPSKSDFMNRRVLFKEANWILVMHGLGLIDKEIAIKDYKLQPKHIQSMVPYNIENITKFNQEDDQLISHRAALQWLIDNPEYQNG